MESAELAIVVGELAPGSGYTRFEVAGDAQLGGTLRVVLAEDFQPGSGQFFQILQVEGAIEGTFANLQLPALSGELSWDTSLLYSDGVLMVKAMEADFWHWIAWFEGGFPDSADREPDAKPTRSGVSNLESYAFGLDPRVVSAKDLPAVEQIVDPETEEEHLTITIPKNPAADGVDIIPEISFSLKADSWNSGLDHFTILYEDATNLVVRATVPIGSMSPQFVRVRVEKAAN